MNNFFQIFGGLVLGCIKTNFLGARGGRIAAARRAPRAHAARRAPRAQAAQRAAHRAERAQAAPRARPIAGGRVT